MRRRFLQVDVFGEHPYQGNPLAVVVDAEGLTAAEMQAFVDWKNKIGIKTEIVNVS